MSTNWDRDDIQFPRLIAEAEAAGVWNFDDDRLSEMCESMDLEPAEVCQIIERAQATFDKMKSQLPGAIRETSKAASDGEINAELLEACRCLTKEIDLSKLNIRKDFSLINAHAYATKVIRSADLSGTREAARVED